MSAGEPSPTRTETATVSPTTTDASPTSASPVADGYALVARWGGPVALPMPADVDVLPDGSIVVGGLANGDVAIFDADGTLQDRWRVDASTRAIATSPGGTIFAWARDGLVALDADGTVRDTIPVQDMPPGEPPPLADLAVAPDGTVYLAAGLGPSISTTARVFNGVIAIDSTGVEAGRWELPDPLRMRHVVALPDDTLVVALAVAESAGASRGPDRLLRLDPTTFSGDWVAGATTLDGVRRIDGLAALPDGGLAVLQARGDNQDDAEATTLVRLDVSGSETGRWTLAEHGGRFLSDSVGMAALPDGALLVVDGTNHRVMRVDADGEVGGEVGGVRPEDFGTPQGIAIGPDGTISVIDGLLNRVTIFSPDGDITGQFALPGRSATPGDARDVAVGSDGRIYAAGGPPGEIAILRRDGTVIDRWSQPIREVAGRITVFSPARLAIGDDTLYLAMYPDAALDLYTPEGNLLGPWPFASDPLQVLDVAAHSTSAWALVSNGGFRVERLDGPDDDTAEVVVELPKIGDRPDIVPVSIAIGPDGAIYLADPFARLVVKVDAQGHEITRWELGTEQPRVVGASLQLAVGADGRVYVADSGTGQVLVYAPE